MTILKQIDFEVADFGELALPPIDVPGYASAIHSLEPLAYWRLGEQSGTTFADQMGNDPLSFTGTHPLGQDGALLTDNDDAVLLDGVRAQTSGSVLPAGTGDPFSIAFWIRVPPGSINGGPFLGQFFSNISGHARIILDDDGRLRFLVTDESNFYSAEVVSETWRVVVLTRSASGVIRWYFDGQLDTQASGHDTAIFPTKFTVGALTSNLSVVYLDELAVFDEALSLDQVRWLNGLGLGQLALPTGL